MKKLTSWFWLAPFLFLLAAPCVFAGQVVINEIMYHPASGNLNESYVELYNPTAGAVDLSGWQFTKGIQYIFPANTVLAAGGYLVVAADGTTFAGKYPGVLNVMAGWTPPMSTHLQLSDTGGNVVSDVNFSKDGDWATRILTTNYPAAFGILSWEWLVPSDGIGASLELMNPNLPESYALNWDSSTTMDGTPGGPNSIAQTNIAPIITGVIHSPAIPKPTDVVTVSARIVDEHTNGLTVTLFYRNASTANPPAFSSVAMFDDGTHNDGLAADGLYAAILPTQPNGTVIEFYLQATDLEGHVRVYPKVITDESSPRTANLLYQVDGNIYNGSQPVYRLIMTEMERQQIYADGRGCPTSDSDANMNATFISVDGVVSGGTTTQTRYNVSIRNRGHGSRTANPNNYHVSIPSDRKWKDLSGLNLNSQYAFSQVLGSAVFRRLNIPMAESRAVQVAVNSTNLMSLSGLPDNNSFGSYAANEQYNKDFISRAFPLDSQGNSYRGIRQQSLCDPLYNNSVADLTWHGAAFAQAVYTNAYFKQNNIDQNDWSDLIDLLAVLNSANGHQPANYVADVRQRLNVDEWMQYMAVNTLLDNDETCLANGVGDDYALYRGTNDTRFLVLPYDNDTLMGRGLTSVPPHHSLFRMTSVAALNTFMKTPEFAPVYFQWLHTYATTTFAANAMNPFLDQLFTGYLRQGTIDTMKAFNANQVNWVLSQIPMTLTVSNNLTVQSGYPRTTSSTVNLNGTANAIDTRSVLVNGTPATWSAWQGTWTASNVPLTPGINRLLVQSLNTNGVAFASTNVDIWYDDGSVQAEGGTIAANTTWTAAGGPYNITSSLTIASGATLTIQPGTTVYLGSGVNLTVANGGILLAEGTTNAPIRFTVLPGSGVNWGGVTINGGVGSPETRIAYADFEGNGSTCIEVAGGTIALDHTTFLTTTHQYLALDSSSFLVSYCYFPTTTAPFELVHGTGGIKSGGRGIVRDCFFGTTTGYNDIMDFTGGNRDLGQAIIQYYNNVFIGGSDDMLDLDGTDAWVENNIFLHCHRNGSPDSSSAISGGNYDFGGSDGVRTSEITIIGNLFFDCDNAADAKEGNFYTFYNNTIVHTTKVGGVDIDSGVVNLRDTTAGLTAFGAGTYLEGNIISDAEKLVRNYDSSQSVVTFSNNIMPYAWAGPGGGNVIADPLFKHVPQVAETQFTTWSQAQIMRDWLSLLPGSPAIGTGPNGLDQGGLVPMGVSVSGEPTGTNNSTSATLTVGILRSGSGIPTASWAEGSGFTHYKWKLDAGSWSAAVPTTTPISLTELANGPHFVSVSGENDAGYFQDDPAFGPDSLMTTSRVWTVDTSYVPPVRPSVRLNEILAANSTTLTNSGTTPDLIELYNNGTASVDLSGMGLTTSSATPYKYIFPAATPLLGPGQFLVLFADSQTAAPGIHLGFNLSANGDAVYLYAAAANGGALLDSIQFGIQAPDLSIGRGADGNWVLCQPTFGTNNLALPLADVHGVKINEWLADELFLANNDFIELFNPGSQPVALGGTYLSNAEGAPALNPVPALSFMSAGGYQSFVADGNGSQGANHVNFTLNPDVGQIMLSDAALNPIDVINYGPQTTDVSQGRSPSGGDTLANFSQPTPGGPNPAANGGTTSITNITSVSVTLLDITNVWRYDNSGTDRGTTWYPAAFNDSAWSSGTGLFGFETTPAEYPYAFHTTIPAPNQSGGHITVYYRTHFNWNGSLTNVTLVSTNFVDDGAAYYLNGVKVGALRMPASFTYSTLASDQANEGVPEILPLPSGSLIVGDNVMAVEVHQTSTGSSDDVFGMQLNAVQLTTNIIATSTVGVPVVLNEILASNRSFTNASGATPDWIELFNTSTNNVNLADLSLSDDPNAARKFIFAPNTIISAGGFLMINCDNKSPVATNNTGFALNASGGTLFLFNSLTNGGGLIDSVAFGLQVPDFSIGRTPDGSGSWTLNLPTPGAFNETAALDTASGLKINEWLASNPNGADWFELANLNPHPVSLSGLSFTKDLNTPTMSPIPPLSFIGAGADGFIQFFADKNPGADHVNFKLSKSGLTVGLFAASLVDAITFGPQTSAISEGRFPDGDTNRVFFAQPTPAASNFLPLPGLRVNEVLSHAASPLEQAVEFYNSTAGDINLGGWFISNSQNDLKKYRIADNTLIPANGFKVFYEYQFNPTNGSSTPFTFDAAHGDHVYLSQADGSGNLTGYRATVTFGAATTNVSFGNYLTSLGKTDFVPMSATTFGVNNPASVDQFRTGTGAANPYPLVGPIVINEIMFQPPSPDGIEDNIQDEYLELRNITGSDVPLFDPAAPTNTWQLVGGVDFVFPQSVTLPAGQSLLVVSFDPLLDPVALAEFRSRYNVSNSVSIFGPYNGHLSNNGESLALYKPDAPLQPPLLDAGFVPSVLVEQVSYLPAAPWPIGADGTGSSLQRLVGANYGNDPANWFVGTPTAGRSNTNSPGDLNGDGLPDAWQLQYFSSIDDPLAGPAADPDGDGFNNLQEYQAGTSPVNLADYLKLNSVNVTTSDINIRFTAVAGKTYSVLWTGDLSSGIWNKLADVAAQGATGPVTVTDPATANNAQRFYRLVTPQTP